MDADPKSGMARELFERACQLQAQGDLELAGDLYRRSIALSPSAEAHSNLGCVYRQQGRLEDAISECRRAIAVDPALGNPYNDIGACLIELERPGEAIPWLEQAAAARRYAAYHFPWYNLGRAYAALELFSKARDCFAHALDIEPDYQPAAEALEKVRRLVQ